MMNGYKVKTFRFIGSKCEYTNGKFILLETGTEDIDRTINDFVSKNVGELIDIKVATVDSRYHNNGGYNNVDLIYTIVYKEI